MKQVVISAIVLLSLITVSSASDASAAEEKRALIDTSAPAAPPESAAARIALRQHREVAILNRFTLPGNILKGTGDLVDHWIVMFCPGWHDKCQGLLPSYELLGVQWENKLNKAVMSSSVRFAKVDCATEKALCVSLDIDDYPSVVHYRNQQRVNSWHGGAPGLVRFVKQELEGPKSRPKPRAERPKFSPVCADLATGLPDAPAADTDDQLQLAFAAPLRTLCFALMLMAATHYLWTILTSKLPDCQRKGIGGCPRADEKQHAVTTTSVQVSLPKEWGRNRQSIQL